MVDAARPRSPSHQRDERVGDAFTAPPDDLERFQSVQHPSLLAGWDGRRDAAGTGSTSGTARVSTDMPRRRSPTTRA
jgi:hypothetical protein